MMTATNDGDRLLTLADAGARIGRSADALRLLIHRGRGPQSVLIDGRRMVRLSDLEAYIRSADAGAGS